MKRQPHREEFKCLWWSVVFLIMVFLAGIHLKETYHEVLFKENPLSLKQKQKESKTTNKEKRHFLQEHHLYLANYFVNGGARSDPALPIH